jgi:hypothetical protein
MNCTMGINCGNFDGVCYQDRCIPDMEFGARFGYQMLTEHWNEIFGIIAVLLVLGVMIWYLIMFGPMVKRVDVDE